MQALLDYPMTFVKELEQISRIAKVILRGRGEPGRRNNFPRFQTILQIYSNQNSSIWEKESVQQVVLLHVNQWS